MDSAIVIIPKNPNALKASHPEKADSCRAFWLVDCLAQVGKTSETNTLLELLVAKAAPHGLLAQEYDPGRRRLAGKFPQAFTHVGLVNSAQNPSESTALPPDPRGRV